MCGVLLAGPRLLLEPGELREQQRRLKFCHAQVAAVADVGKGGLRGRPAVVVEALAALDELLVVAENGAALAGIQVLGGLETEAAEVAQSAELLPPPFAEMRLA